MKYNPEIHRRRSIRLRDYDYTANGAYFVTICSQGRECLFGEIGDSTMILNNAGRMVEQSWLALSERFPQTAFDEYAIMPNHFHGIFVMFECRGEPCVRPKTDHMNQGEHKEGEHKVRPYGTSDGSVGRIIQAFKSISTNGYITGVNNSGWPPFPGKLWQRNYYERVIRSEKELNAARQYILDNPMNWAEDDNNPVFA